MGTELLRFIINKEFNKEFNKESNKESTLNNVHYIQGIVPIQSIELSPKIKEKMRKIKSEEDFIKLQVPWIL